MSDINLDFTVETSNIQVVVDTNEITFTPTDIQLTLAQAILLPGGTNGQLQYNNGGLLGGVANTNYDGSNLTLGNVSNVKITGGVNGYFLQTDGTGNLTWSAGGGGGGGNGTPGGSNTQIQYNDSGAFGGNVGFTFNEITGQMNVPGNIAAVGDVTAGNAGISGTLSAGTIGVGNISATGNIQVNNIVANANITANLFIGNANNLSNIPGANVIGTVANASHASTANTVVDNSQPNITSVGTLVSLDVTGNLSSGNANLGNLVVANYFSGDGYLLSNIPAANINGSIGNANFAAYAGNVTQNAQPNITSLGTLTGLSISGNLSVSSLTSTTRLQVNSGNISLGLNSNTANNAANAIAIGASATVANTGVSSISIGRNAGSTANYSVTIGPNASVSNAAGSGNGTVAIGHFASSRLESVRVGAYAGGQADARRAVSIGYFAGYSGNGAVSGEIGGVAVGAFAGGSSDGDTVAVGYASGNSSQKRYAVAVGSSAGQTSQGEGAIAVGRGTGLTSQGNYAVAVGAAAAQTSQGNNAIAIGASAGGLNQSNNAIAIGVNAGANVQGLNSIAIGANAAGDVLAPQANNSIVINATGANLNANTANALFIKPVRTVNSTAGLNQLYYDSTTGEIVVYVP